MRIALDVDGIEAVDWARLAAFIDGEGTITIARCAAKRNERGPKYMLLLTVTGTYPPFAAWLSETFGGPTYWRPQRNPKHKSSFWWRMMGANAFKIIQCVRPYLLIKDEQADLAIDYWMHFPGYKSPIPLPIRTRNRRKGRTPEQVAAQEGYTLAMRKLNRKGVAA